MKTEVSFNDAKKYMEEIINDEFIIEALKASGFYPDIEISFDIKVENGVDYGLWKRPAGFLMSSPFENDVLKNIKNNEFNSGYFKKEEYINSTNFDFCDTVQAA